MVRISLIVVVIVLQLFTGCSYPGHRNIRLTGDGAWCWFSDPRAVYLDYGKGKVLTGWVSSKGNVEACVYDLDSDSIFISQLYMDLQQDDHNNPAFVLLPDGSPVAMYTRHSGKDGIFINHSEFTEGEIMFSKPDTVFPYNEEQVEKYMRLTFTYANPFLIKNENNRIYCFGRWTGFKPNIIWSDDNGLTWSKPQVMISREPFDVRNRPYVKYFSDGRSRIHISFTDGHPRNEPLNSVYYAYYEAGSFFRVDGSRICGIEELPFSPEEASKVYEASDSTGRAWIWDIVADASGFPAIVYTRCPEEDDHRYHYARFNGRGWMDAELCKAGKWFPETPEGKTEPEPHYSGGLCINPSNPRLVYLSREVDSVFEIERWELLNSGDRWKITSLTHGSEFNNVRPFVPAGIDQSSKEIVLWMENHGYIHYEDFNSSIVGIILD